MTQKLTHFDERGAAHMVDVGDKAETHRVATAAGYIRMRPETLRLILDRQVAKGDVLEVARLAGIMATKRTSDLIPLCHPISLSRVEVAIAPAGDTALSIVATAETIDRTGVEMEALTAASVAALTLYDMAKAIDRGMRISFVQLEEKSGGKSGDFKR